MNHPMNNNNNHRPHAEHAEEEHMDATGEDEDHESDHEGTNQDTTAEETSDEDDEDDDDDEDSRVAQLRAGTEAMEKANEGINSNSNSLFQKYRVVGHWGCQVRETEAMNSKPVFCLKRGTIVSVLKNTVSDNYDILPRRVLVNHTSEESGKVIKGWASIQSSQGYVILSHSDHEGTDQDTTVEENSDDDDDDNSNDEEEDDDDDDEDDDDEEEDDDEDDEDEEEEDEEEDDDGSSDEDDIPTPEEVDLEYTYPRDFVDARWPYVIRRTPGTRHYHYFRLRIDPSCTTIRPWALANCKFLIEIVFAENCGLTEIGRGAFEGCKNLQRMNPFPTGLLRLLRDAFSGCRSLSGDLVIPCTVVLVDDGCFQHCEALTSVVFQPSLTTESKILSIMVHCFEGCTSLLDISLPNTVQELRACAFKGCTSLTTMDFPPSCVDFGWEALRECTALHTLTIRAPSNAVRIEKGFLQGCTAVTTIQCHPWIWSEILYSTNDDNTFLNKFVSGTLTLLSSIQIYSWYGAQMLEVMNDQPNAMYQILREFQHQLFDTQNNNNTMETEEMEEEAAVSTVQTNEQQQKRPRLL